LLPTSRISRIPTAQSSKFSAHEVRSFRNAVVAPIYGVLNPIGGLRDKHVRGIERQRSLDPAESDCLQGFPHQLDILLRHRQLSIPANRLEAGGAVIAPPKSRRWFRSRAAADRECRLGDDAEVWSPPSMSLPAWAVRRQPFFVGVALALLRVVQLESEISDRAV
jgi:hypothetical protein